MAYSYNLSTNPKRQTSFGYGRRISFKLNNRATPSPAEYDLDGALVNTEGKTFGLGRNVTFASKAASAVQRVYLHREASSTPSLTSESWPRRVRPESSIQKRRVHYAAQNSLRQKLYRIASHLDFIEDQEQAAVPGPGEYHQIGVKLGRNFVSKFRSINTPNPMSFTSNRFSRASKQSWDSDRNPGPGNYRLKGLMRTEPSALNHSSTSGTLSKSLRTSFTDKFAQLKFAPGPGNYRLPSDFGHYRK